MAEISKESLLKMSLQELDTLAKTVADARSEKAVLLREDAKSKIMDFAKSAGVSVAELFGYGAGDAKPKRAYKSKKSDDGGAKAKGEPVFRHPENPELTANGQGRKPRWLVEFIENGGDIESLRIKK